jgi:hypothetical protein
MAGEGDVSVGATCECGCQFDIPLAGKELETLEFQCPGCGKVDRFTTEQIASLVAQYGQAVSEINDKLKSIAKGSKIFQYRPK